MLGNGKIDQVSSFTYTDSIPSEDCGCSKDVKSRIVMAQEKVKMTNN